MTDLWLAALSYVIGSFPSAYLATRMLSGQDIRRVGSGNVGGMNAARNVGLPAGIVTGILDVAKGALAVYLARSLSADPWLPLICAVAVVAGHNWMLFLGLKGGKGLGASAGAMLVLLPVSIAVVVPLIAVLALVFRNTYMGVVVAFGLLPLVLYLLGPGPVWAAFGAALAVVVIAKHVENVRDYLAGARGLT
ncbi:MAG: glycerol-3-phosphate acyltransferase [bacterium]|nr:glycerol-3-phosphate acyltransferase [bacterium]